MGGCLSAPVKLLGMIGVLALLGLGWLYRDRLADEMHQLFSSSNDRSMNAGRPGSRALLSARSKIDSLNGWRADSVILSPPEVASMIGVGLDPSIRSQLDSLEVQLHDGSISVGAVLATARLPRELTGPLAMALRSKERVEAAGPLQVVKPGLAEWAVQSFKIRNFPLPKDAVPQLVSKALGDPDRQTVPVRIPAGIRQIRIQPSGAILYGVPR
jgi:hypothetical protein